MNNQLAKAMMCIQMRSGVEIWIEEDKAERLQDVLEKITESKFIRFEKQTFNTADVVGVFLAGTMSDTTRRKNGMWQCQNGNWHDKGERDCSCLDRATRSLNERRNEAIQKCGKCASGYIHTSENSMGPCECQKPFLKEIADADAGLIDPNKPQNGTKPKIDPRRAKIGGDVSNATK